MGHDNETTRCGRWTCCPAAVTRKHGRWLGGDVMAGTEKKKPEVFSREKKSTKSLQEIKVWSYCHCDQVRSVSVCWVGRCFFLKNGFGHFKSPLFNHHLGKILFQPTQANLSVVGLFFRCSIFLFVFCVLVFDMFLLDAAVAVVEGIQTSDSSQPSILRR